MLFFNQYILSDPFETAWALALQKLLSMGFSQQECQSELPFPFPGSVPDSGIKSTSPALAGKFFTTEQPGKPIALHKPPLCWPSLRKCTVTIPKQHANVSSSFALFCLPNYVFSWAPKSLWTVTAAMKLKDGSYLEEKLWPTQTVY